MAGSTVREWMETQNDEERERVALDIAGSIDLGVMGIQDLLQDLQPYLNDSATQIEAGNGMKLFSIVLTRLEVDLGRADVHTFVEYFCGRLENKHDIANFGAGIKETAISLQALASMTARFPRGDASAVAKAVFSMPSATFTAQLASTRLSLFELLDYLFSTYSATITRDMGADTFVSGLVSMAEFEKDPRCLTVLFQMYAQISESWKLNAKSFKAIWDSYCRYFPISLKSTDPSVPTREELQQLLLQCFTSHDDYAVYAIPHLFDALDTTQDTLTASVKNTVLETFEACVTSYSPTVVIQWSSKIWDALKFEVWDGSNDDFIKRTLNVLKAIIRELDKHNVNRTALDTPFVRFVLSTSTECSQRLQDSKPQHVLGSGQILHVMASSSHLAFDLVTRNVLPRMVLIWDDLNSRDKKTLFLGVLNDLLQARLDLRDASRIAVHDPLQDPAVVQSIQSNEASLARSLTQYQQSLVDDILFTAMMEHDSENDAIHTPFGINVIKGLVLGARIPRFLSDYHKGTIISKFNDLLVQRSQAVAVHHEVVSALQQISVEDPDRFRDITMSTVMNSLPNYVSSDKDDLVDELNDIVFVLEALTQVACTGTCKVQYVIIPSNVVSNFRFRVFDQFQRSLMRKLFDVLLLQHQLPYANAILAAMFRGLELFDETLAQEDAAGDVVPVLDPRTSPYAWIVIDLFRKLIKQKQHENGTLKSLSYMGFAISLDDDPKVTDRFVSLLGRIATLALRSDQTTPMGNFLFNMDRDMIQEQRPSQVWYLFCEEKPADLISMSQPSLDYGPAEKCLTNVLSMSLVAGIRREDKEQLQIHIGDAAMYMMRNAISTRNNDCSAYARISMLHFLQLLINKFGAARHKVEQDRNLAKMMVDLTASCATNTDDLEVQRTYQTLAYFTAACLAAGDRADKDLIEQMFIGISHPRVGRKVAQSFRILLLPSEIMNEENFCVLRKLRKQRLYSLAVERLVGMWRRRHNKDEKENYLIALTGVLAYMELAILKENAVAIFPLALEGTNVNDDKTMHTCILLIHSLIIARPEVVSHHVDSIINRMTDRTYNTYDSPSDASVKCRVAALEVLGLLVKHGERRELLRRKAKLMVELDVALDDCSRNVRSAAERTKMRWFNLVDADP